MVKVWKAWFNEKYLNFKTWSCLSLHFAAKTFRRCNRHCSMLQHHWQIGCLRVNVLFVCGDFFAKFLQSIWKQCIVFSCSLDFWQWRLNWVDNRICAEGKWGLDWHVNTSIGSDYTEKQYVSIHPIVLCDSTRRYWNILLIQIFFGANYAAKSVFNLFVMVFVWSDPIWD